MVWNEIGSLKELLILNMARDRNEESRKSQEKRSSRLGVKAKTTSGPRSTKAVFLESFGINASSVRTVGSIYTTYSLALSFRIPLSLIFGTRMFTASLALRRWALSMSSISFLPQSVISVGALVHEDSPIMTACRSGDLPTVQQLFQTHQARPDDITADNITTMKVCQL
jgi:hypothetical protein